MRFKIDWVSLIVGRKFTVFALFYFEFEGNFPSTSPRGAYVWRGDLTEGFLRYRIGGLIHGGAFFQPRPHFLREKPWERGWLFFGISPVSFDAFWKFLWLGKSSLDFWGVKFWSRDFLEFCLKP